MTHLMDYPQMEIFEVREKPTELFTSMAPQANIKVIGAGGGGSNAVNCMIEAGLKGVEFIAVNTDVQDLINKSRANVKLQIGSKLTHGMGAGGKPNVGEDAAKEDHEKISELLRDSDMVFVTAGMGGGTGTGSAPVIARIAREHGALTVGVVTKPFGFEGSTKMKLADDGIKKLRDAVDTLIVIPNQNLFKKADSKTTYIQAFAMADDVLRQGVQGISDLITNTGHVNTDFADVKATMKGQGDALMGIGLGSGDNRAKDAADMAIDNPLLEDTSIEGATRLLINISGPDNIGLLEVDNIVNTIKAKADPSVEIIYGINRDMSLGESVKVTVIATGFQPKNAAFVRMDEGQRKSERTLDFIPLREFEGIRGSKDAHKRDTVYGINSSRSYYDNLDEPTVYRKNAAESDANFAPRTAAGAKEA